MADVYRIVVPMDHSDVETWHHAADYAVESAAQCKPPSTDIVLLTHAMQQLDGTPLAAHLARAQRPCRRAAGRIWATASRCGTRR